MPMHDWTRVEAGIFHAFHHEWISEISRALNRGLLPAEYYALPEQIAAGFGLDVLTLQDSDNGDANGADRLEEGAPVTVTVLQTRPQTRIVAETEGAFYRRTKKSVVIRHSSGDRVVAMIEIVSPGNKSSRHAFETFVDKACELLERRIHLLIVDPFPPGPRDPQGIHAAIWDQIDGSCYDPRVDQPLTLVAYKCELVTRAYLEPRTVGDPLPSMPLFLEPNGCVLVPLEDTYSAAFNAMPMRWRNVLATK